jgi:hypothetical protein
MNLQTLPLYYKSEGKKSGPKGYEGVDTAQKQKISGAFWHRIQVACYIQASGSNRYAYNMALHDRSPAEPRAEESKLGGGTKAVAKVTFHSLRRSFVTRRYAQGTDIQIKQAWNRLIHQI